LVPKKAKDFKKSTAEETGYSEELVNLIIDFYWEKIRKDMSDLVYPQIAIPNLGTFKIKHWKLDETVENYERIISRIEGKFRLHAMRMDITDKLERIAKIKEMIAEDQERLNKKKELRNEYDKSNMEKQSSNMAGLSEQDLQERSSGETIQGEGDDM
jgi:hypothetical protein